MRERSRAYYNKFLREFEEVSNKIRARLYLRGASIYFWKSGKTGAFRMLINFPRRCDFVGLLFSRKGTFSSSKSCLFIYLFAN